MASRSIPNVFEITYGRSSAGLSNAGADIRRPATHPVEIEDDGLGCFRALAVAMMFNAMLVVLAVSAWELWKYWR